MEYPKTQIQKIIFWFLDMIIIKMRVVNNVPTNIQIKGINGVNHVK